MAAQEEDVAVEFKDEGKTVAAEDQLSIEGVRVFFDEVDTDGSGKINLSKFSDLSSELGEPFPSEDEARAALESIDSAGSGEIEFSEFFSWFNALTSGSDGATKPDTLQLVHEKVSLQAYQASISRSLASVGADGESKRSPGDSEVDVGVTVGVSPPSAMNITLRQLGDPNAPSSEAQDYTLVFFLTLREGASEEDIENVLEMAEQLSWLLPLPALNQELGKEVYEDHDVSVATDSQGKRCIRVAVTGCVNLVSLFSDRYLAGFDLSSLHLRQLQLSLGCSLHDLFSGGATLKELLTGQLSLKMRIGSLAKSLLRRVALPHVSRSGRLRRDDVALLSSMLSLRHIRFAVEYRDLAAAVADAWKRSAQEEDHGHGATLEKLINTRMTSIGELKDMVAKTALETLRLGVHRVPPYRAVVEHYPSLLCLEGISSVQYVSGGKGYELQLHGFSPFLLLPSADEMEVLKPAAIQGYNLDTYRESDDVAELQEALRTLFSSS